MANVNRVSGFERARRRGDPLWRLAPPAARRALGRDGPLLWLLPVVLLLLLLGIDPFVFDVRNSFREFDPMTGTTEPVGWANRARLFSENRVLNALRITGIYVGAALLIEAALGLGIAPLLNTRGWGAGLWQSLLILPLLDALHRILHERAPVRGGALGGDEVGIRGRSPANRAVWITAAASPRCGPGGHGRGEQCPTGISVRAVEAANAPMTRPIGPARRSQAGPVGRGRRGCSPFGRRLATARTPTLMSMGRGNQHPSRQAGARGHVVDHACGERQSRPVSPPPAISGSIRRVSPFAPFRRGVSTHRPAADGIAVGALLALLIVGSSDLLRPGAITVGLDSAAFFYPMFSFLGERLRAGDVPGWNPYQFAGAPFAADPESGWTYLPAMLCFALLPLAAAAKAFALVHLALAGLGTYALARALRIGPVGALTAGLAFAQSGLFADRLRCCLAYVQVGAWLPAMLLGAELAARSQGWRRSLSGWALAGFALSQILAAWLGQGASYALLILGAYVGFRTLLAPPFPARPPARLVALATHAGAILTLGFALAAAGLLPRLAYHARSNLAEGYAGDLVAAADAPGWPWRRLAEELLGPTGWYVGGAVLALAVAAPLLPTGRRAAPAFAGIAVAALVLAWERATPLHAVLFALLPGFEALHRHAPTRILPPASLASALLAGAAVNALARPGGRARRRAAVAAVPALVALGLLAGGVPIPLPARIAIPAVCLTLVVAARLPRLGTRALPPLLALLVFADLLLGARRNVERGLFATIDLARFDDATGAAAFLRDRPDDPPPRFFGYDPSLRAPYQGETRLYLEQYRDPRALALLVNNRATLLRLPDLQGYNPIQPVRYVEFLRALNGHRQEYHGANVFPAGLDSPLLDLLGARYLLLPVGVPPRRVDLRGLLAEHATAYQDGAVRVAENRAALPRAWIVHEARRVARGDALPLLAAGAVDPRRVALLEREPPPLAPPADPAADEVEWLTYEPDRLRLRARTDAPGLLLLSEGYDRGWRAAVDGAPAPVLVADHALRAVPLPAGTHTIELRYEPPGLRLGLAITLAGYAILAALLAGAFWPGRRSRRPVASRARGRGYGEMGRSGSGPRESVVERVWTDCRAWTAGRSGQGARRAPLHDDPW